MTEGRKSGNPWRRLGPALRYTAIAWLLALAWAVAFSIPPIMGKGWFRVNPDLTVAVIYVLPAAGILLSLGGVGLHIWALVTKRQTWRAFALGLVSALLHIAGYGAALFVGFCCAV